MVLKMDETKAISEEQITTLDPGSQDANYETPTLSPPPQFSDLVRATQFGRYDECRQYLETSLFDVNQRDREDVTLLHWAAINNHTSIVDYYLSKGAEINAIGGDLKSTPLQWASRQGHLATVVVLIKRGADTSTLDCEGCNVLHLAAQFGHTAIVAYLVAKGMDIDLPDSNGMTALMWSSYRVTKVDPTRLLLTLGSSHKIVDYKHKNTALHWAVYAKNLTAITLLLDAKADVEALNINDESPLDMARKHQAPWLVKMLENSSTRLSSKNSFPKNISNNQRICSAVQNMTPFLAYLLIAYILESGATATLKVLFLIITFFSLIIFSRFVHNSCHTSNLPVAVYLSMTFWLYYTMFYLLGTCKLYKISAFNLPLWLKNELTFPCSAYMHATISFKLYNQI